MDYAEFRPKHPLLIPYIEYFNSMKGNGIDGKKFISLPEGKIGMVFLLGGHTRVNNGKAILYNDTSRIWGLIQAPNFCEISADVFTFCVVFKPGGLCQFLPSIPVNEIAKSSALLTDIYGKEIHRIEDLLFECKTFAERIKVVEKFLLGEMKAPNTRLNVAVQLIQKSKGNISVAVLSNYLNISSRQLQNIFKDNIGLAPKQFIRMMRFKHSLFSPPNLEENMAQYANRIGCYDESHFIHEFQSFAGMTPRKYFQNLSYISDFSNFKRLMID